MLQSIKQLFHTPICLNCGSYFVKSHLFCESCYEVHIEPRLRLQLKTLSAELQHAYLIEWSPGESDTISEMVYRFKDNRNPDAWSFYADLIAHSFCDQVDISDFNALVPIPGSRATSTHAHTFAKHLSEFTGLPILDGLRNVGLVEQKRKTAVERSQIGHAPSMRLNEVFTQADLASLKLIYVDDIMTTGQTFKHCREALGDTGTAVLVTLFYRSKAAQT